MLVELTKETRPFRIRIVVILVAVLIIVGSFVYLLYDTNRGSLDMSGKSIYVIDKDSMDGDVNGFFAPDPYHPDIKVPVTIDSFPAHSMAIVKNMTVEELQRALGVGSVVAFKDPRLYGQLNENRVQSIKNLHSQNPTVTLISDKTGAAINIYLEEIVGIVVGVNQFFGSLVHYIYHNITYILIVAFIIVFADILLLAPRRKLMYKGPVLKKVRNVTEPESNPPRITHQRFVGPKN